MVVLGSTGRKKHFPDKNNFIQNIKEFQVQKYTKDKATILY